ncbi:MAG: type 3 dihydrofolate reductase [Proteobacteria bacterium]|nr:type 3 dihydrofolate reductase [Pseudomonadota bacterium]
MTISLIAAMSRNHVIGFQNHMPWHLPADLKHFQSLTLNKPIIMGRKTFESIGKPLPNRINIVVTRDHQFKSEGVSVVHSLEEAIELGSTYHEEIMIIGGAELYRQTLSNADRLYITRIDADFEGDAFFPEWDKKKWTLIEERVHQPDEKNLYCYSFLMFERISN